MISGEALFWPFSFASRSIFLGAFNGPPFAVCTLPQYPDIWPFSASSARLVSLWQVRDDKHENAMRHGKASKSNVPCESSSLRRAVTRSAVQVGQLEGVTHTKPVNSIACAERPSRRRGRTVSPSQGSASHLKRHADFLFDQLSDSASHGMASFSRPGEARKGGACRRWRWRWRLGAFVCAIKWIGHLGGLCWRWLLGRLSEGSRDLLDVPRRSECSSSLMGEEEFGNKRGGLSILDK